MGPKTITLAAILCACGDNRSPEANDATNPHECDAVFRQDLSECACCYAAQIFASRNSPTLIPSQEQIDRYFTTWARAVQAEPILRARNPQDYRLDPPSQLDLATTNPQAVEAWSSQLIETGDETLDAIISQVGVTSVNAFHSNPGGAGMPWNFILIGTVTRNEEIFAAELSPVSTFLPDAHSAPRDDGQWTWIGDPPNQTAQIDFTFGWGDCFVACDGFHRVRAVVPFGQDAVVYDLGGDPLPPNLSLSPNTRPPP